MAYVDELTKQIVPGQNTGQTTTATLNNRAALATRAVVVDEGLPDDDRIAPTAERLDDQLAIRLTRTGARRPRGSHRSRDDEFLGEQASAEGVQERKDHQNVADADLHTIEEIEVAGRRIRGGTPPRAETTWNTVPGTRRSARPISLSDSPRCQRRHNSAFSAQVNRARRTHGMIPPITHRVASMP